jgi:hypothetical protein
MTLGKVHQQRMLLAAGHAPGGPHIEQPNPALHLVRAERSRRGVQRGQAEGGRWLVDQGGWDFMRVALQAQAQKNHQAKKQTQRDEELFHAPPCGATPAGMASVRVLAAR